MLRPSGASAARPASGRAQRATAAIRDAWRRPRVQAVVAALVLAALAHFYLTKLTAWLVNDDEGSYLYAAWRIGLGELPYRDFLTPQLPAFLFPGGALMRLVGPEAWPARAMAVAAVLAAGAIWWRLGRRLFGPGVALVGMAAFLLHPDVYAACRTFRPEPFMLLWQALGTLAFAHAVLPRVERSEPPRRAWLAVAGALFGVATLTKLFGPWPLAGLLLFLLDEGRRRGRPWRAMVLDAAIPVVACGAIVTLGMAASALAAGPMTVWQATVGHHIRQGASKPLGDVVGQGFALFALTLRDADRAVPMVLAAALAWHALRRGTREERLIAWPLVTAAAFLVLSRDRYPRHLLYLAPHIGLLFALAARRIRDLGAREPNDARWARLAAAALVVAVLGAWRLYDRDYYQARTEDGTARLGDVLALLTPPDASILSDYSELNFYARRPTTYSAASLSSGAVRSGQIGWPRLQGEIAADGAPALLALELDSPYSHLRYLSEADRAAFEAWRDAEYALAGTLVRTPEQRYGVYAPREHPLPEMARFAEGPTLLAAGPDRESVAAGDGLQVLTAWRAPANPEGQLGVTVRLVGADGRDVAQMDVGLLAAGARDVARWAADELTALRVPLTVPAGTPPGTYALRLGVYRRPELAALTATGLDGAALAALAATGPDGAALAALPTTDMDGVALAALPATGPDSAARAALAATGPDGAALAALPATGPDGAALGPSVAIGQVTVTAWRPSRFADPARTLGLVAPARALRASAGGLALVGAGGIPTGTVTAGEVVPIALAWRVDGPPTAVAARLTLVEPMSGAVAADRRIVLGAPDAPDAPNAPPGAWPSGAVIRRVVSLPLRADAAAGHYGLVLALEDAAGTQLAAPDMPIGTVAVAARDLSDRLFDRRRLPPLETALDVALGDVGTLVGAHVAGEGTARITVTLAWQAAAPSDDPLQVTVQLLDADGRPVAQHDGPPAAGARPTTGWLPGEYIVDAHTLAVPADLPPGRYALVAALYQPLTGARLPATAPVGDGLVRLGEVRVGGEVEGEGGG